ncbi:hypothetical protein [Dyella caseinilytica]|uniref:Heme utilization protein n=1 Tax=Dyella caseinilytica TaxID=1849581 RepID=A0ABX7GUU3_9GAMM|nr:hypothetical protein [Dyella caseinilytica]QRN54220.1 hypothetical protein ISN74_02140 [Dyella caseinilytica]GFZ92450.1 hypothetical protein GCM10011408_10030 [Dyella caseinilytica]
MNANLRRTLIALTVLSVFGASMAYAGDDQGSGTSVKITKKISLTSNVNVSGNPYVNGTININAAAVALSQATQNSSDNSVSNNAAVVNDSNISGDVGNNASGNVGVNQAAGDFNAQGNSAAISAAGSSSSDDASFTFGCDWGGCGGDPGSAGGMADAETFANQTLTHANTSNQGTTNNTNISGDAFDGASGNVGVNQAAGDNNEQLNQLAAATTSNNVYALATSTLDQEWSGNKVSNDPYDEGCFYQQNTSNNANLSGDVLSGASGNIGLNQASGTGNLQSNSLSMAVANTK